MNELFFWLLGSAVPIALFSMIYYGWLDNFLSVKNAYRNCQFMSDVCKGYLHTKLHVENAQKNKIRWAIFGSRYIDLLNYHADKLLHEVDHLTTFECSKEGFPLYRRHSFLDQWDEIEKMLLEEDSSEAGGGKKMKKYFGHDPFGWMSVVIEGKIFELYRKYVLHVLRTKGYESFNETLCLYDEASSLYPINVPMSAIHKTINRKIIFDSRSEIAERILSEFNTNIKSKLKEGNSFSDYKKLINSFTYKQAMYHGDEDIIAIRIKIERTGTKL